MLVLSRKALESVWMHVNGKKIKVQVVETGNTIRLGIQADPDVAIYRDDLTDENGDPIKDKSTN